MATSQSTALKTTSPPVSLFATRNDVVRFSQPDIELYARAELRFSSKESFEMVKLLAAFHGISIHDWLIEAARDMARLQWMRLPK